MNHYCSTCNHWQPLDKSWEIGACTDQPELPIVLRFRFKREEWQCWQRGMGTKHIYPYTYKPLDEPAPVVDVKAVTAEFRREINAQVGKAYWYIKKLAKAAAK